MPDPPLRVLITDPHLRGGGQVTYVTRLAAELTKLGHDVTLGCRLHSVLVARAADAKCSVHNHFHYRGGARAISWTHDLREMRRYIRLHQPDVIHVNGSQDHWVAALANRWMGSPCCLVRTRHNTYTVRDSFPNRLLNRHWTTAQIVVCEMVRNTLAAQATFDSTRLSVIHNGVDPEIFCPNPESRKRARNDFGYMDKHLVCGLVARLVPAKGHEFLLRAAAQLKTKHPELRYLLLGQGVLEGQLRALAAELEIEDKVQFAGFRDDMPHCVQAVDIAVQPSVDCDTSSFTLKEQMATEIPVITSDYGGLTEIVEDGVEGYVVLAGTVPPLAKAIATLAGNPALRAAFGKAGRQRVLKDFSVDVFAHRTLEAYQRAIEYHREDTANR